MENQITKYSVWLRALRICRIKTDIVIEWEKTIIVIGFYFLISDI